MNKSVSLAIDIATHAAEAVAGFDDVGDAADRMATNVDQATSKADAAGSRLDSVAESSDRAASSSAQAAGGLGDLGGALGMLPGPLGQVGAGMEALAAPIMGVTGAADLLNLATESSIVAKGKDVLASKAQRVATIATAGATKAAAVAQRILNAAMKANPIGLAITALTLLVAGFVLAYKKSETFRNIVNGVMGKVRDAIGWVIEKVQALVDKVKGPASAIWNGMKGAVSTAFGAIKSIIQGAIDVVQKIIDKIEWAIQKARDLAASVGIGGGHNVTDPPSNPGGTLPSPGGGGGGSGPSARGMVYAPQVTITGTVMDRPGTAAALQQLLDEHARRLGLVTL